MEQPTPQVLQRIIAQMQSQRNQAMDALAVSEAKMGALSEELAKTQGRIKELEARPESAKIDPKAKAPL